MDYRGLYHDLAEMERRALNASFKSDFAGNTERAQQLDDFIWELQTFMGVVVIRQWR